LDEHRAKLNSTDIEEIEKEVSSLRTMLTDSAVANEDLKAQINTVKEATMKIGKVLY